MTARRGVGRAAPWALMLALLFLPLVSNASSAAVFTVAIHTDAGAYSGSDRIVISGMVTPAPNDTNTAVFITVSNPDHILVIANSTLVNATTGAFVDVEVAGGTVNWIAGQYLVNATWGAYGPTIFGTTSFAYSPSATTSTVSTATTSSESTAVSVSTSSSASPISATTASAPGGTTSVVESSVTTTSSGISTSLSSTTVVTSTPAISSSSSSFTSVVPSSTSTRTSGVSSTGATLSNGTTNVFTYVGIATVIAVVAVIGILLLIRRRPSASSET